ncbi:hypothetical protein KBP53_07455 [Corynebacterium genitalium ATCC 33030]|uniref:Uncharacterized protein n=1 Tax=Corynebacterium genitalium ATCC 33030 TaxID=585529 RepID=D7WEZ2_9CORY|nr:MULTISPECIES: hypothetical protein [Corynebacterium]EFK53673.1 hypothetical protein HMPREF0291_11330 [Corynebacterium genitalium ATCC 33030]MCQ4617917.1 hypothetical protein [Corynebacterium pseudogenitalium]MCQ4622806.1 hypothetical protein [Corynebacterium sp. CCUG 70398]UUA88751.1 hypothetical protein KBP53_07455 [Corynebacterium genitalium ATCC 33030]
MPAIQFDVLVPDDSAAREVGEAFTRAVEILVRRGKLSDGSVRHTGTPDLHGDTLEQLRGAYREERGEEPDGAVVHRYVIEADGASSMNSLAMGLSRVLTPKADLPKDPVALERQMDFELPAVYPWAVEVLR